MTKKFQERKYTSADDVMAKLPPDRQLAIMTKTKDQLAALYEQQLFMSKSLNKGCINVWVSVYGTYKIPPAWEHILFNYKCYGCPRFLTSLSVFG